MSEETYTIDNSGSKSVSNDKEVRYDGKNVTHEHFSLKSSQTKPFDTDRISGSPISSKDEAASSSASGSEK